VPRERSASHPHSSGKTPPRAHFATKSANCCLVTASWLRDPNRGGEDTMRTYFTATGMAVGLLAVWAALVPFVS
jgi:hypothetical protein